ncbi:MAG: hypothetical protein OIF54_08225, partial [Cohaesibacter sp.]|nr:hypothetical protein [Cohaesibacter sp.]
MASLPHFRSAAPQSAHAFETFTKARFTTPANEDIQPIYINSKKPSFLRKALSSCLKGLSLT